ncbi:MAG: hypothetical protein WEC75_01090 [Dehalococcoidia bacterium]
MSNSATATHEPTIANADLWSHYFRQEWGRGMGAGAPLSGFADGTAARVANFLTMVAAGPIAWLYSENAPQVGQITGDEAAAEESPLHLIDDPLESVEDAA